MRRRSVRPESPRPAAKKTTSPPYASMIIRRSLLTPSGITATKRSPSWVEANAIAILVEPLGSFGVHAATGLDFPARRGLAQDVSCDPVLGRAAGVQELQLAPRSSGLPRRREQGRGRSAQSCHGIRLISGSLIVVLTERPLRILALIIILIIFLGLIMSSCHTQKPSILDRGAPTDARGEHDSDYDDDWSRIRTNTTHRGRSLLLLASFLSAKARTEPVPPLGPSTNGSSPVTAQNNRAGPVG